MYGWTKTPLEQSIKKTFDVFEIKEKHIDYDSLPTMLLSGEHYTALTELKDALNAVTKSELEQLEPEDMLTETVTWETEGSFTPSCLLYNYKADLTVIVELLTELNNRVETESYKQLMSLINEKLDLINTVVEEFAKSVFTRKIKQLAESRGLTQQSIADALQTSQQNVNIWFNKNKVGMPSLTLLTQLSCLLETSIDFLIRPDAVEVALDEDTLYKSIGITADNCKILKGLVKANAKNIIATINLIIETYDSTDKSLLVALNDYFKLVHNSSLYVLSDDMLSDLAYEVQNASNIKEARSVVTAFVENQASMDYNTIIKGTGYDIDKALLTVILQILTRMKDNINKDFFG